MAHVDIAKPLENAEVEVREMGDLVGFPGQVLVRFDAQTGELYGMTFQRWSSMRRTLMWRHRTFVARKVRDELVAKIVDFFSENNHHHRQPALIH
ncbi:MAG: hypothetical protein ACP5M4_01510 [Acidobacteriaceae bacterium]